jgi:hypothetical protein
MTTQGSDPLASVLVEPDAIALRCADGASVLVERALLDALPAATRECAAQGAPLACSLAQLATALPLLRAGLDRCDSASASAAERAALAALGVALRPPQHYFEPSASLAESTGSATGALVTLAARGIQNVYTEGRQQKQTYGRGDARVAKDDAYAEGSCALLDTALRFGAEQRVPIQRLGDGWAGVLCKCTLPPLPSGVRWRSDVAEQLIAEYEVVIGGSRIYHCSGALNAALGTAFGQWPAEQARRYAAADEAARANRSRRPWLLVFPLLVPPMWRGADLIELIALPYHTVELRVRVAQVSALVDGVALGSCAGSSLPTELRVQLEVDYVFMSAETRDNVRCGRPAKKDGDDAIKRAAARIARPQAAVAGAPQLAAGLAALRCFFNSVDRDADCRDAERAGLWNASTAAEAQRIVDRLDCKAVCTAILHDPRIAALWSRFCAPQAAMVERPSLGSNAVISQSDDCVGREMFLPQVQWESVTFDATADGAQRFQLNLSHPCSLLLLAFRCDDDAVMEAAEAHPFQTMQLLLNGQPFQGSDAIKAHEYNWLKCGARATPAPHQKHYLLPFSKDALAWSRDGLPCTTNMSRIDRVELQLQPNRAVACRWQLQVGAVNLNIGRQLGGMFAAAYSN